MKNPYIVLGLTANATMADIRLAYHKLAKEHHPDHNPDSSDRFQDITWAWNILRNPRQRKEWDEANGIQAIRDAEQKANKNVHAEQAETRLNGMIPQVGSHIVEEIRIDMAEAYNGANKQIAINTQELCQTCGGSGAAPGTMPFPCTYCNGLGKHKAGRLERPCSHCKGRGAIIEKPCRDCNYGVNDRTVTHDIHIMPRSRHGQRILIKGGGLPGWAMTGDLIVELDVSTSHNIHEMAEPGNLLIDVPITWSEAVLGGQIAVPTPNGSKRITIPPGTPSEQMFRIRGEGLHKDMYGNGELGDLYIRVRIHVPTIVAPDLRRAIVSIRTHEKNNAREELIKKIDEEFRR